MSKFLPDPQIQSLRAMRAGDIAFGQPPAIPQVVGVVAFATAQPIVNIPVNPVAVPSVAPTPPIEAQSPVVGEAFNTTLSQDAAISVNAIAVPTIPAITSMPSESPVVGVATSTSVM